MTDNDPLAFLYQGTGHAMPTKQAEDLGDPEPDEIPEENQ